jgi:phosphoribosylformylglycinamidine synthase
MLIAGGGGGQFDLTPLIDANDGRLDRALFGETASRVLVAVAGEHERALTTSARDANLPVVRLGTVGGEMVHIGVGSDVTLASLRDAWASGLRRV